MPPFRHRLSLLLLPADPDAPATRAAELFARLDREGFLVGSAPGPRDLVAGGFASASVEASESLRFLANRQGGFAVTCPRTGVNVVPVFNSALEGWRVGGLRALECPCGERHDLAALRYRPEAGFARGWVTLVDVADAGLTPEAEAIAAEELGGLRVVGRRG